MKRCFFPFILFFIAYAISAQDANYDFDSKIEVKKKEKLVESPYSIFGDNTVVLQTRHEEEKKHLLEIPITEDGQYLGMFELDFQTGVVNIEDQNGNILYTKELTKEESARFTSIDPRAEKYYSISPYVYVANNPIRNIDPRGDTIFTMIDGAKHYYGQDKSTGYYGFLNVSTGAYYTGDNKFANSLRSGLARLQGGDVGDGLVNNLMNSTRKVNIEEGSNQANLAGTRITWNPNGETGGMNTAGNENRPSYIGLGHEMAHTQDIWNGTIDNSTWVTVNGVSISNAEKYATHIENQIRSENNIPLRTHYGIQIDASGNRVGLESTRIISSINNSLFYKAPQTVANRILLLPVPFTYRRR